MKKTLLILLCFPLLTLAQQTYVPDDNFEAYLEANNMGNGIANDDSVTTANINTITSLDVSFKVISDLTGIEDFTSLTDLDFSSNQLTSL
ncbi:MAG: T9SS C-terminal target domain-containing protein, partial [Polaribacter sp.]|nr:T9SS C-terminal target domain-containing protein [Polaribacter sp.]